MKKLLSTSTQYLPFLAKALDYTPSPLAQCILCVDAVGMPIAGVIYDGFNGQIIHCHIWIDAENKPCREWYAAIFDYPFNRLQVGKIIGQVNSNNLEAVRLDEHLGFVLEAKIDSYYDDGASLLVYTMKRSQCGILNKPAWRGVISKIQGGM